MVCAKCGRDLAATDSFCADCGAPNSAATPTAEDAASNPATSPSTGESWLPAPPIPHTTALPSAPPFSKSPFVVDGALLDPVTHRALVSWWRRVGAYLLDGIFVGLPLYIVTRVFFGAAVTTINQSCDSGLETCRTVKFHGGPFVETLLVDLVVSALYFTVLIGGRRGQTMGMRILHFAIRDAAKDTSIGYGRAFLRWLVITALGWALVIPVLIDYLSPLWDPRRQAWHDHAARSVAVELRSSPWS
jgi:uncharacterized RDD family membrane protein YckC